MPCLPPLSKIDARRTRRGKAGRRGPLSANLSCQLRTDSDLDLDVDLNLDVDLDLE